MKKVYKSLTDEQKSRKVIFSSCLSTERTEQSNDTIHEVLELNQKHFTETYKFIEAEREQRATIERLKNDKFFNGSIWKFNIIRT